MGLLDFNYPQSAPSGLLSPPPGAASPEAQKWADALSVVSAALKDAGAYMQHNPAAAGNVAAVVRQRAGLQPANAATSQLIGLPPTILTALLLHAAQQNPNAGAAGAPMLSQQQAPQNPPQLPNQTQTAPLAPGQNPGWAVQKVR